MIDIIITVLKIALVLFVPGIILSLVLTPRMSYLQRLALGFGLSVFAIVILSLALTYLADIFGIKTITSPIIIIYMIFNTTALAYLIWRRT